MDRKPSTLMIILACLLLISLYSSCAFAQSIPDTTNDNRVRLVKPEVMLTPEKFEEWNVPYEPLELLADRYHLRPP